MGNFRRHGVEDESRYPSTSSRETVGQPAKNSLSVKPLFRSSSRRRTGTRVPQKQGVPCIRSGSTETISLRRAPFSVLIPLLQYLSAESGCKNEKGWPGMASATGGRRGFSLPRNALRVENRLVRPKRKNGAGGHPAPSR